MITDSIKAEIRSRFATLSSEIPNFRSRPAQRVMIAEVAKTFAKCPATGSGQANQPGETILVVQGGTGTGKSAAYGLSGVLLARLKGKKLVISSATVALQEQLLTRDLPLFMKAAGIEARIVLAKGRTRYVCQYRLHQTMSDMAQAARFDDARHDGEGEPDAILRDIELMAKTFADGQWDGDRDTRSPVADDTWRTITTDRNGCLNRVCPHYATCAQMNARARVKEAEIVIANHDLVLADLSLGGGKILPAPADTMYVFDEAHFLPEKAVAVFSSSHLVAAERKTAEKIAFLVPKISEALGGCYDELSQNLVDEAGSLEGNLRDVHRFFASLSQLVPTDACPHPSIEFKNSCIPPEFFDIGGNILAAAGKVAGLLSQVGEAVNDALKGNGTKQTQLEKLLEDTKHYVGRIEDVAATWQLFLAEPAENAPPVAKWIEAVRYKKTVDYRINSSPVIAAEYLKEMLWEKAAGVVLTSATMSTLGSFDDFLYRSGLRCYGDRVAVLDLPSPFDYAAQGTLEIPPFPSPKNYHAHTNALVKHIGDDVQLMAPATGMLVLFTSKKKMNDIYSRLPKDLQKSVLIQGTQSKESIIREHKSRIDRGDSSVIFGLESFSVGVDLPGSYCIHVQITQLPFSVPDDPVVRALSAWIAQNGGDPFMQIAVPDAARKIEQSVGRLIRTEEDFGRITVTDPRLWDSSYGRAILRGLPPFRIIANGKEVYL